MTYDPTEWCKYCKKYVEVNQEINHDGGSTGLPLGVAMGNIALGVAMSSMYDTESRVCKECGKDI